MLKLPLRHFASIALAFTAALISCPAADSVSVVVGTYNPPASVAEGNGTNVLGFQVSRSGSSGDLNVNFTVSGTASASDYTCNVPLTGGSGFTTIPNGFTGVPILFTLTDDALIEPTESIIVTITAGNYTISIGQATGYILDNDSTVSITATRPTAYEEGEVRGKFLISRVGNTSAGLAVNFNRSGSTATFGTPTSGDYYLSTDDGTVDTGLVLAPGVSSMEIRVVPRDDSAAEDTEFVNLNLTAGNYIIDPKAGSARVSIIDNDAVVSISGTDTNASESGNTGLFTVTRTADTSTNLYVRYTIGGTASNGVDYAYLSNVVMIPAGQSYATITVAPLFDYLTEGNETVTLTLVANGYQLGSVTNATVTISDYDDNLRKPPVIGGGVSTNARYGRFSRGSGNVDYQSFVIPIDFQQGIALDNIGGNATALFTNNPWSSNFNHYNATNPSSPIQFANPIVAFGNRVGGSPLYYGQPYTFGVYAGHPKPSVAGTTNFYTNALRIQVYDRNSMALVGTSNIIIPDISTTNEWAAFLSNGYTRSVTAFGLTTILSFNNGVEPWGLSVTNLNAAYHITHSGSATTTQYVYMVELAGGTSAGWLVTNSSGRAWSRLYTLEFEERPAWRTLLLQTPQFFPATPIPPGYIGRSFEELLTNNPAVTNVVNVTPSAYTNLDQSPELRQSPVLDQLVADLGNDPILLANYVLNEIELTDAIEYNDNGAIDETAINLGGVNRGALATLLEGQGSPTEQCGLLVYLLRKAGYPAAFVFPPHNGMQIIDARLSKLLRTQIYGASDELGSVYTTNRLIPVNYPWVAAYIGTNWVHIFPWLKDTEVIEGENLYDFMPPQYDNAFKWARSYALGDTNLLALSPEDGSPITIYQRFLEKTLRETAPDVSVDDIGIQARNRRHYYSRWADFPAPTYVTNANTIVVESLGSSSITNVTPLMTNIFNTVSVEISSVVNPTKKVASGEMRVAELLNRRLIAWHTKVNTTNHTLTLSLAPFRTNITATKAFSTAQLFVPSDTNAIVSLTNSVSLNGTDDQLKLTIVHNRHRSLPGSFSEPYYWTPYLGIEATLSITNTRYLDKGDLVAICFDAGRVTRKMLDQHALEIWAQERAGTANANDDKYQGEIAYLTGMSYYEKADKFNALATRLHKAQSIANFASGIARLKAQRDPSTGQLPSGNITYVQPIVDMFYKETVAIGNQTAHLDSGDDGYGPNARVFELAITAQSALEHATLNRFYKQADAVSTVRLLQLAQTSNTVITLNRFNYLTEGDKTPPGSSVQLKNADSSIWSTITAAFTSAYVSNQVQVFITPGEINSPTHSFRGVGALIFMPGQYFALIGGLNGGFAPILDDAELAQSNLGNVSLQVQSDNSVVLDPDELTVASGNNNYARGDAVSAPDVDVYLGEVNASTKFSDTQDAANDFAKDQLGITGSGIEPPVEAQFDTGVFARTVNTPGGWVSDPVNSVTGEFYIDATDLSLPGPMPLQVRRNYSSHNVFDGDFGYGWKLNYAPFLSVGVDSTNTLLYAAEPDGTVVCYRRQRNGSTLLNTWTPLPKDNARLQNLIGSVGNLFNGVVTRTTNSGILTYTLRAPNGDVRTYKTNSFKLGTGSNAILRNRPYLDKWQDSRGNYFKFIYGTNSNSGDYGKVCRVESSNGNFLGFNYDVYGHITEAFTGDGRRLVYEYDDFGDLVTVTLPDASETSYEYLHDVLTPAAQRIIYSTHLMLRELKPEGRILQNDFDKERRVINQYSTVGADSRLLRNASFSYSNNFTFRKSHTNFVSGYTLITDYLTNTTRYEYTNSLVTKILDPLNRQTRQIWYLDTETNAPAYPRSLKQMVDRRGLVTDFKYDSKGNLTSTTVTGDITGAGTTNEVAVTSFTYNTNSLPTKIVDAVSNQTVYTYTNPISPFLRTSEERYSSNGTLIAATVFDYFHVTNTVPSGNYVGSYGLLRRVTRAFGSSDAATNELNYDPHGFVTADIRYTRTSDPTVSNAFFYNLRGQMVEKVDAAGRATRLSYDPRGNVEWREVVDEQNHLLSREAFYYNENGELTWSDGPRFGPEDYVWRDYDGAGRKTEETHFRTRARTDGTGVEAETGDAEFASTFYEYDPFNNLVKVIDPRGHYTRMTYDVMGQLRQRRAYDGTASTNATPLSIESFAYEPGGLIAFATNALGGVTENQYTYTGKPKYQKNATGATNAWRYYLDGRTKREVQGNGAYWETIYDDANRRVTRTFYTASGTALATNITETDRRGNVIRTVDAAGSSFTNIFDGLDRLKIALGPVIEDPAKSAPSPTGPPPDTQQAITNYYDAAGKAFTNVNALSEKTIALFDALGRVTRVEVRDKGNTLVRETDVAYSTDFQFYDVTEGSSSTNPIVTRHFTDTMGHEVLTLRYPSVNTTEYTWQAFDAAGNRTQRREYSVTSGTTTLWSTNLWTYDALNRLQTQTERDGAQTVFNYDAAGDLTNRVLPGGLTWQAQYNSAGQMLKSFNLATGVGTRTNTFSYYAANTVFAGLLQTSTDGRGVACTHLYDSFLRPNTNSYTGLLPEQNQTTTWQYDARGFATNITENFAYSTNGPPTTIKRHYDPYGQLDADALLINGVSYSSAGQEWDSGGRRAALNFGDFRYTFGWFADGKLAGVRGDAGSGNYAYTTAGLLASRSAEGLAVSVASRDGVGRVLARNTTFNAATVLQETLTWTGDGLAATHSKVRPDFTDSQSFDYATGSRRLATERVRIDSSKGWTNLFQYDEGSAGGAGVLTKVSEPQTGGSSWSASLDVFNRIDHETNNVIRRLATGRMNASNDMASIAVRLDGRSLPLHWVGAGDANWRTRWQSMMELRPGVHTLQAEAAHSSGLFTTNKTSTFTNSAVDQTTVSHFAEGQLSYRVWVNSLGQTNRVQTFKWDGRSRLIGTTETDSSNNGYTWSAVYDAFGRRLQTTTIIVTNGVALTNQPKVTASYFDPAAEFLELGVTIEGRTSWKIYGPDLNGSYGGLNGTGGLEGVVDDLGIFHAAISDARGNVLAQYDPASAAWVWTDSRPTGYGAVPEYRPVALVNNHEVAAASAWRGKWPDLSGLYWIGARYYDPIAGRFISCDPLGHDSDPSLYAFANGDPINYCDADGRMGAQANGWINPFLNPETPFFLGYGSRSPFGEALQQAVNNAVLAASGFPPVEYSAAQAYRDFGRDAGSFAANTVLNAGAIQEGWQEITHADFSTPIGWATFGVAVVDVSANVIDAGANLLTLGGKGALEAGIRTGLRETVEVGAKETAQFATRELRVAPYSQLARDSSIPGQAHHLNQTAAYREVIPPPQGVSTKLEGNAITDVGSPHYNAHESLESFWQRYRDAGTLPTNLEYTRALADSLRVAGKTEAEVQQLVGAAIRERVAAGQLGGMPVPRVPGPLNQVSR